MAFGKEPLTDEQKARFRAEADSMLAERQRAGHRPVPALGQRIREELELLRTWFGRDRRLVELAVTFALLDVKRNPGGCDGEEVIEARIIEEKLEAGERLTGLRFASWGHRVATPPPKAESTAPVRSFCYAAARAVEMYWAFSLTNGRQASRGRRRHTEDSVTQLLLDTMTPHVKWAFARGARFDRDIEDIVSSWVAAPRALKKQYRASGNCHAPLAFLARCFDYDLDRERRRVGGEVVAPAVIRRYKRRGLLDASAPLTEEAYLAARSRAAAAMRHAPPAGFLSNAGLREELEERKELGAEARTLAGKKPGTPEHEAARDSLSEAGALNAVEAWLRTPARKRGVVPDGYLVPAVGISARAVDGLVKAYEATRDAPFERKGRTTLIPVGELDAIVAFANRRAQTRH